jgi:hypothetical protein
MILSSFSVKRTAVDERRREPLVEPRLSKDPRLSMWDPGLSKEEPLLLRLRRLSAGVPADERLARSASADRILCCAE